MIKKKKMKKKNLKKKQLKKKLMSQMELMKILIISTLIALFYKLLKILLKGIIFSCIFKRVIGGKIIQNNVVIMIFM